MKSRFFHLDILRIIAIFSVILMHASSAIARLLGQTSTVFPIFFTYFFNSITRFAVPLFLLISGSLMINSGKTYNVILKRVGHFLIVFLIWRFIYTLSLYVFKFHDSFSLSFILDTVLLTLKGHFHFWYIFLICGLYLVLPFIDILVQHMTKTQIKLFISLSFALCFIIPLTSLFSITNENIRPNLDHINVGLVGGYCLYFMLGYWLKSYTPFSYKAPVTVFILSTLFTIGITFYLSALQGSLVKTFLENLAPNIFLMTVSLFLIVKKRFQTCSPRRIVINCCEWLSKLSFGVYLVHLLIQEILQNLIWNITHNAVLATFVLSLGIIALSYLTVYILYKIPLLRKIIT